MLSRCFSECGFDVMPIDHIQNRFHPLAKICNLSLTEQSSWDYLFWLVDTFPVAFCHCAPPCGTSSRARELANGPPPLRNEAYPWGFPDLGQVDRARVEAANFIYRNMALFIERLISMSILFSVENPTNNLGKGSSPRIFRGFRCLLLWWKAKNVQDFSDEHWPHACDGSTLSRRTPTFTIWKRAFGKRTVCICNCGGGCLSTCFVPADHCPSVSSFAVTCWHLASYAKVDNGNSSRCKIATRTQGACTCYRICLCQNNSA